MNRFLFFFFFFLSGLALTGRTQELPPKSDKLVTDFTGTLSADQVANLERKLVAFDDTSSTQIAVVLLRSTGDYDISDYGVKLGRAWGIGQKGKNNGILMLVAVGDRKMTIQTGYGTEGAVPDAIASQIIERQMKPAFRRGDYYGGIDAGTNALISYTKGEYKQDKKRGGDNGGGGGGMIIVLIIVVVIFLIVRFFGGGGGGSQVIGRRGSASPFWWFLAGNALGRGGRDDWGGGWGGGGSSGGGGFGGFGGGSFGGGGASGSW